MPKNDFIKTGNDKSKIDRRHFISKSGGFCLGCLIVPAGLIAQDSKSTLNTKSASSNLVQPIWSSEQAFNFAYRDELIPILLVLASKLGRERLVELLKAATDEIYSEPKFISRMLANYPKGFYQDALTQEGWTDEEGNDCMKVTRCLWAETFRKEDASDLGYAILCYADYAVARNNHQNLERPTTLMQGHDCCQFRWTKV